MKTPSLMSSKKLAQSSASGVSSNFFFSSSPCLIEIHRPVAPFELFATYRLVFDRETGKPRGYGFCEFAGVATILLYYFIPLPCSIHTLFTPPSMPYHHNYDIIRSMLYTVDHETAQSAVRNLNNVDCGGRPLRIDLADSDPFLEGKTTMRGELIDTNGGEFSFLFFQCFCLN